MPDKKLNLSGAKEILSSEGPKLNLSGALDILKKKDQAPVSATGGFGSQLGSQTFQPTKDFVPVPLIGKGVEDYKKGQKAKAQAEKELSQKLQSQQDIYYQAQGKQSAFSAYDGYQSSVKTIDDEISKNYPDEATAGPRTQSGLEDYGKYKQKRDQLVLNRNQFESQSDAALRYINPIIESDINSALNKDGLKSFTRVTGAGFEVPDEYKIDSYAKAYAQQNGVSDNGTFKRLVYDKLKSSVSFNISKPKIQKEFDVLFKKEFGVNPDQAIQKDYLDNFTEAQKIKTNLSLQVQSLNNDIKTKLNDGSKALSLEYKPRLEAISNDYKNQSASLELKSKQLGESYKSGLISKENYDISFNNIKNELTTLNTQYQQSFDAISKEFLNNQNELYSKYDKRYKRQISEFTGMAEQQIADASSRYGKSYQMSNDLRKKYQSIWSKATNKYLTGQEAIKSDLDRSFVPNNLGLQFAKNLFIGLGSGIKSISSMYDFDAGYVFGDYMENSITSSSPEIKSISDLLDATKVQSSLGRMLGGMAPALSASALAGAVTKSAPTAVRLLTTGLANYISETAQIGGGIKDTVFQKTGNIADANKAAKKAVDANMYLLPLYALDGLPFLDDITLGIKNTFVRAGAKAGIETLTELPQEYFQGIFEDLAISDKPISDTFRNMTLEKFENTALNVIPTTVLLGGGGTAFKGAKEEIAKIQGRAFAAKSDLFDLTQTAKKQFVYDTVLRRGDVFTKAYISSLFNSGNINEQELESFSKMIEDSNKTMEESKKIGLNKVQSKIYAALKFDYIQSKNEFDSEQDEVSKKLYKAKMDSAEKSLTSYISGNKPDAVVLTLSNNEQYIYSFETLNSIIDEGGDLLNQIIDGDVKVGLLTDKSNPKAKALSDKLNKIKKENAVQEPSTTSEVSPVIEGGQVVQEGGEGVGQGVEGTQAPQAISKEEVTYVPTEEQNKTIEETVGNQQKGTLNTRWADWFLGESKEAKSYISDDISKNKKLQDAMKSKLYDEWKKVNNSDISFEEFLNSEIDLFRGGIEGDRNEVNVDGFNSWELTEEGAKKFAKGNPITKVKKKVKDLYGIVDIVGGELEVLEPTKLSEDYAKRVFESQEMTDKMFDNLSIDEQKKVTELSKNNKYNEALNLANYLLKNKTEAPQEFISEEVSRLREQEQQELAEAIPNIEEYKVDGKVDKGLITNRKDLRKYNKIYAKYDKLITPLLAEATAQAAPAKVAGVSSKNKSQLDDLKSRVTNAIKSAVIKSAERAIVTLKSILPDFDIVIHEDEDSYNRATGNPNTRGNFSYSVNPDGTYTGTIDINLNKANERTVAHEVTHAVLLKLFGENTKLFKAFRFKISKILTSSRNKELVKFANLYGTDVKAEEYLVELNSILEQEQDTISPTVLQQIAAYINEVVSKLTNGAIKPFENIKDTKDIIDFFNTVSKSIREGAEISESDIKAIQEGASINIGSPTTINKSQKGEAIEFPDKPLPLSFVTGKDKVDIIALINDIVDKKQKVWFWMADQLGRGDYYDAVIDGKHYLDAGPSFALDPKNRKENILWASGVGRKALQDKINEADYIFFISGSPEKAKLFNRRVLDLVAERINVNSDFKSFKNAINSFVIETNDLKDIKSALDGVNSFEELAKSPKRKPFLIAIDNIGKNKTMKPGSLKELLNGFDVFVDYNELRDGFYKENGFNQNDIMLVGKPTGLGGKAPHSTYENAIMGEVVGVPDVRMNSWDIMPQELRDRYKDVITGREEKTKPLQTKVIAAEIGQVRELEGQLPVSKSQKIDEELSKASGTTQRSITTSSYINAANELNKLNIKGRVLDYGAGYGLGTDAMSDILGKPVESYEINSERWKGKKPVTYKQSANIDGKFDAIVSLNVLNVVPRNTRDFIIQDIYNHLKDGGKAIISSRKFKDDIDRSKNFEVGPEEKSYFVKVKEDGKLIDVYQKGFDGNELVDYVKEVLGNKVDVRKANKGFGATGVIIEKLPVSKSQKIEEENNREALRVAGLPYLENTLNVLSAKFGMPYKVIYNETLTSTGSIDYDNYGEPTIIVNTANATNDTPLIQYGNIFINQIKNTNKNLFSGLVKQVLNTKEGQAELELAKQRYENDDYEDQVQQAIVSLLAKYGKNYFDPKTGIHKAIKKIWDTILEFLSNSFNVNISEIPPSTTMEELSKILSHPNISINKTTYSETIKEELVEESKRALEKRKKEYSEIEKIPNPRFFEINDMKFIGDKKQFEKFYNSVKEIVETLKNYKDNQLLVDLTNIKSQISTYEGRDNFDYDRYPLFTKLLKFISSSPRVALITINNAIESGEDIREYLYSAAPYITALDDDLNITISDIIEGYSIGGRIGVEPPSVYRVWSSTLDSVDEVKAKLENDIEGLNKAIENPELGADYYRRSFRVPVGDDTYRIVGNYRDGNISIEFSSDKYGMRDANEALFFKVLPKVIDAISYMYSDVDYNTISFYPISGESSKGQDLRLKGYNIFAKRLFGDFSLVAQNDNTTIIPIPEIFKNRPLNQERTVSRSQKIEGEEQAPQKGGPLARIKQAIEKSRKAKSNVGPVSKPVEFDEFELVPREKVAEDLRNSIETPFRNEQALKTKNDSFIKRAVHNFMKASTDRKYSIVKEIVKKGGDLGELVRATIRNSKGYTGKASHIIRDINSKVFDKLSINPNLNIAGTKTSERELFDTFLNLNRIINIDNRITEKFSELVGLSNKLKKGFRDKSLSQEQLEELGLQIARLKDYLANRKSLKINGIDADTKLIGEQGEEYIPYNSYRDMLRENYEPKQYKHSGNRTYQSTKAELNLIKETYPEVYKKFEDMSMKYYDAFRTALDDQYKNGLIGKEVYDDLYSYNYIPTKYIEKLIEDQISLESPAQAAKLSSSIKNLSGGSEGDVLTNFQGIMDTYINGTYKRIYDNTSAKTLSEAVKSASNSLSFKIQQPNGRARNGKETYASMPVGMDGIYFFEDGVKSRIIVPKQFADEWYGREFNIGPSGDAAVIALKRVFLTNIFKAFTTKYNPLFGVLQVLVDAPQAIIASNAYPDLVLGSLQLVKDYKTVAPDIVQLIKNNKLTPLMEEAIDAGIFSDFLSTENDLFKTQTLVKQNGTIDKVKYAKYLRDRVSKAGQSVLNKLAQFNEGMEYATRLAVYSRVRKNLINKFKKQNPGKELSEKDMFRITQLASAESRGIIDFSVNGTWGGTANKFLAYLNPAIQGFASVGRALKNNPWKTSVLLGEIGVGAVGVLAYSLGAFTDDDDEKRKRYAEYMQLSPYQRINYFNIYNPLAKDENRKWIKLFRKVQPFRGWANLMEQTYLAYEFGAPIIPSQAMEAFKADLPVEADMEQLITKAPLVNAYFKYFENRDAFRKEEVVQNEKLIADWAEGRGDKNVDDMWKNLGEITKGKIGKFGPEGMQGLSPVRTQAAIQAIIGDPSRNPTTGVLDAGTKAMFYAITGDKEAMNREFSSDIVDEIMKRTGLESRMFARPSSVDYEYQKQLQGKRLTKFTKTYNIKADINNIYNSVENPKDVDKEVINYLLPLIKDGEITKEYAKNIMNAKTKIQVAKTLAPWADDLIFAQDNDEKIDLINYYTKEFSDKKFAETLVILKGYEIINEDVANASLLERTKPKK